MTQVAISAACTACGACLATCPEHALRPVGGRLIVLEHCTGCLQCVEICPADAIFETDALAETTIAETTVERR